MESAAKAVVSGILVALVAGVAAVAGWALSRYADLGERDREMLIERLYSQDELLRNRVRAVEIDLGRHDERLKHIERGCADGP